MSIDGLCKHCSVVCHLCRCQGLLQDRSVRERALLIDIVLVAHASIKGWRTRRTLFTWPSGHSGGSSYYKTQLGSILIAESALRHV